MRRLPGWYWLLWLFWLVIGLPAFILAQGFRGYFSILPGFPVWEQGSAEISTWAAAILLIYLPVFLIPYGLVHLVRPRAGNENANAQDR